MSLSVKVPSDCDAGRDDVCRPSPPARFTVRRLRTSMRERPMPSRSELSSPGHRHACVKEKPRTSLSLKGSNTHPPASYRRHFARHGSQGVTDARPSLACPPLKWFHPIEPTFQKPQKSTASNKADYCGCHARLGKPKLREVPKFLLFVVAVCLLSAEHCLVGRSPSSLTRHVTAPFQPTWCAASTRARR